MLHVDLLLFFAFLICELDIITFNIIFSSLKSQGKWKFSIKHIKEKEEKSNYILLS